MKQLHSVFIVISSLWALATPTLLLPFAPYKARPLPAAAHAAQHGPTEGEAKKQAAADNADFSESDSMPAQKKAKTYTPTPEEIKQQEIKDKYVHPVVATGIRDEKFPPRNLHDQRITYQRGLEFKNWVNVHRLLHKLGYSLEESKEIEEEYNSIEDDAVRRKWLYEKLQMLKEEDRDREDERAEQ